MWHGAKSCRNDFLGDERGTVMNPLVMKRVFYILSEKPCNA